MSIELVGGQLYQWETGRQLMIAVDASEVNAIQFANQGDTTALEIEQNFTMADGDIYVKIPDKCLQSAKNLLVYLVYNEASENSDEHKSRIFATKIFPVTAKPRPKNYIPIAAEEALGVVRRLTAAAKEAAMEAEEARVKAEAEKLYAEDAADRAEDAQNAAQNAANSATDHANNARISAAAADKAQKSAEEWGEAAEVAARSAENYEAFSYENSQAAADSKTKAENAKAIAVLEAEKAKAQAANAKNSADSAAASAEVAGDAARDAVAGAMPQIMASIAEKLKTKASINDTTIGPDAWSSKNIVDSLCPPINESSNAVRCVPIKDYPLDVRIYGYVEDATHARLTIQGKNLFDCTKYKFTEGQYVRSAGDVTGYDQNSSYACCKTFIPVSHLQGKQITLNHPPAEIGGSNPKMIFYQAEYASSVIANSGTNGYTATVPTDANFMRFSIPKIYSDGKKIQIELGGTVTSHEQYRESNTIIAGYDWEAGEVGHTMNAMGGTYTFTADVGTVDEAGDFVAEGMAEVLVSGRADPNETIRRLTDDVAELKAAILTMGANV